MKNKIEIKSKRHNYSVEFSQNYKAELAKITGNCVYVVDKNVYGLYDFSFVPVDNLFLIEAVESKKTIETVLALVAFWDSIGVQKDTKVVCFGGGITQDITAFACNIFLRGLEWIFFPTTLLAMCDSCVGGKSGLNLGGIKNRLGVFYPPSKIIIDIGFLKTLSREDYINGWGELIKYSLISGQPFFDEIEKNGIENNIEDYIFRGLSIKKEIAQKDEFEGDLRRLLNFGHTFGHALEAYSNNEIPHGKAVIFGINAANRLAARLGILHEETYLRINAFIRKTFPHLVDVDANLLTDYIACDKKVKSGFIHFVLLKDIGKPVIHPIPLQDM